MSVRFVAPTAALGFCLLFGGCGDSRPSTSSVVKGIVILDGEEFTEEANVNFSSPSTGDAAIALVGPDGTFIVAGGMVPGEYKVTVTPPSPRPGKPSFKQSRVPEKYRSISTSDLSSKITKGKNELKFEMKS